METTSDNTIKKFTGISMFSPAAFIVALLGFFMTFTDINCNGQKIDSVSGFEFVKGYSSDLDDGKSEDETITEKYNPNIFVSLAFLIAILGIVFYFIKKVRVNYKLVAMMATIAFICMILFMIDLKNKISSIDPENNLNTDTYVNLEAEMKFGYWLVTLCFLLAAAWNWVNSRQSAIAVGSEGMKDDE